MNYTSPRYFGVPVDVCLKFGGRDCGLSAAEAWCQLQGGSRVVEVGPYVPSLSTSFPQYNGVCNNHPDCMTFSYLVCATQSESTISVGARMVSSGGPSHWVHGVCLGTQTGRQNLRCVLHHPLIFAFFLIALHSCTPGQNDSVKFVGPRHQGIPLDYCQQRQPSRSSCGPPAASAWCRLQGMGRAVQVGDETAAVLTSMPDQDYTCSGSCSTFKYIVCGPPEKSPPPPPSPPAVNIKYFNQGSLVFNGTDAYLDWCWGSGTDWSIEECGRYVARRWCLQKGYHDIISYAGPARAPSGHTRHLKYDYDSSDARFCKAWNFCQTFDYITCGPPKSSEPLPHCTSTTLFDIELFVPSLINSDAHSYEECCALCAAESSCKYW